MTTPDTVRTGSEKRQGKRRRRSFVRFVALLALLYLLVLTAIFLGQRNLLYFPARQSTDDALAMAKRASLQPWESGGKLIGWKKLSSGSGQHCRVLINHGNAGSAIDRVDYARALNIAAPCDVYLLEYPGYGPLPGSPSQESFFAAADQAMTLLEKEGPVFVMGESLGTGVASYLAGTHPQSVCGLLLVAPYHNLGDVAQSHMPIFPARWMLRDKFPSADYLRHYHGPLAVLLGGQDTTVPFRFGRRLFAAYAGPKRLWEIPLASHNDLPNQPDSWWQELFLFWRSSDQRPSSPSRQASHE